LDVGESEGQILASIETSGRIDSSDEAISSATLPKSPKILTSIVEKIEVKGKKA
jgi:hypothetical protein